ALPDQLSTGLVAAVDADIIDGAIGRYVTAERQVRLVGITITHRAIGTDAIRAIAVVGIAPAAGEAAHPDRPVILRGHLRQRDDPAAGVGAKHGAENAADARSVIQPVLDGGRALLRGEVGVDRIGLRVAIGPSIAVRLRITVILGGRWRRGRKGGTGRQ